MAKSLKIELVSQSTIAQEGSTELLESQAPTRTQRDFFVPELGLEQLSLSEGAERMQLVVEQINRFIDNISDDYFQLGLHLSALHKALRKSGLTTEQVKSWYTENINIPSSDSRSSRHCRSHSRSLLTRRTQAGFTRWPTRRYLSRCSNSPAIASAF
jgi:hypothetical protein